MSSFSVDSDLVLLDEVTFQRRFENAFKIDPSLTAGKYYQLLIDVDFDENKALLRLRLSLARLRRPDEFPIPKSLAAPRTSTEALPPVTPDKHKVSDLLSEPPVSKKRSAPHQITANRPLVSPLRKSAHKISNLVVDSSFDNEDLEGINEGQDDVQRKKRRLQRLAGQPSSIEISAASPKAVKPLRRSTSSKTISQLKSANSSQSTATLGSFSKLTLSPPKLTHSGSSPSSTTPLETDLSNESEYNDGDDKGDYETNSDEERNPKLKNIAMKSPKRKRNQNEVILKNKVKTMATPWLHGLASPFFPTTLNKTPAGGLDHIQVRGIDVPSLEQYLQETRAKVWDHEPTSIKFEGPSTWEDKSGRVGFASVAIDGVTYQVGDCVIVRLTEVSHGQKKGKGKKSLSTEERDSVDELLNPWYARIVYLFEDEDREKMAHFRWFHHGAETVMEEMVNLRELFLLTKCDDVKLECVYKKIKVNRKTFENPDFRNGIGVMELGLAGTADNDQFFYRYHYNEYSKQFTDVSFHEEHSQHHLQQCECCDRLADISRSQEIRIIGDSPDDGTNAHFDGFHRQGVNYYEKDFIYIFDESFSPYRIGQIEKIYLSRAAAYQKTKSPRVNKKGSNLKIKVTIYNRYDNLHLAYYDEFQESRKHAIRDERRLYKATLNERIFADQVDGKCCVRHEDDIENLEEWKEENDLDSKGVIRRRDLKPLSHLDYARQTEKEVAAQKARLERFHNSFPKLRGLDVFAGAGGLSHGVHRTGIADTLWAVEFSEAACVTLRQNFPGTIVYNIDGNKFLDRAIRMENGEELEPMRNYNGDPIPEPPRRGEVEFIFGGSPCPGFTKANQYRKAEDELNSLVILYLSFLDFYRPKYFFFENVEAILTYPLGATQVSKHKITGGIQGGMLKFILRAMTSLGYQAQYNVLQTAEHNTPQSRTRAIFWGAQMGLQLPAFPEPQNVVQTPRQWPLNWHRFRRAAPFPTVTIGDAVTDLPAFEWVNPHREIKERREQRNEREERSRRIAQYNSQEGSTIIGQDTQPYLSRPVSEYQRKLRAGVPMDKLYNHVTLYWDEKKSKVIEQVCNVPLRPEADHRDLPERLSNWGLSHKNSAASRHNYYPGRIGRLDMEGISSTCMTRMDPTGKNGKVLHPTQYRVISLREYQRMMSFPDSHIFDLSKMRPADAVRQTGNAVPPNLAYDTVRSLRDVLLEKFERELEKRDAAKVIKSEEVEQQTKVINYGRGSEADPISIVDDDDNDDE